MLKKEIKFEDFNGVEQTETHYFHLSKSELIELENGDEKLTDILTKLVQEENVGKLIALFKKIFLMSYGIKSPDGRRFVKSPEILAEFTTSLAFEALFAELITVDGANIEFVMGILPKDLAEDARILEAAQGGVVDIQLPDGKPSDDKSSDETTFLANPRDKDGKLLPWAFREPTQHELISMTKAQMMECFSRKQRGWVPRDAVGPF